MEITRRHFLKVAGTSALGTVLFNACRWPEEELQVQSPVEIPEDMVKGVDSFYATQCHQCQGGCGVVVRVIEGRAKKIEGNPDYPVNRGKHSARCEASLQAAYHPDRILTPMRRTGERGSGLFHPISWAEAEEELVSQLGNRRDESGSVAIITNPLRGHLGAVVERFVREYGWRHISFEPLEHTVLRRAVKNVFNQDRLPDFDIENTQYLLSFGADFLATWLSPVRFAGGYGKFRQGENRSRGTLVQVDSHFSMTTANADEWVPIKPGTEGIMALSIAYVIISEGLGNPEAADTLTGGKGAKSLERFAPEVVAPLLAVNDQYSHQRIQQKIVEIARDFATHRPSLALGGDSPAAHTNGLFNLQAIYSLNYLVDSVGNKGGIIFNPNPPLSVPGSAAGASFEEWESIIGEMQSGRVSAALLRGANPAHGLPASAGFTNALKQLPYIASFATVMDDTSVYADLVLPEHTHLQDWGDDVPDPGPGYEVIGFQQPVIGPIPDKRSASSADQSRGFGDELLHLAGELDMNLPWKTLKDALQHGAQELMNYNRGSVRATTLEGFWNGMLQRGGWWDTGATPRHVNARPPQLPNDLVYPEFSGPSGDGTFSLTLFRSLAMGEGQQAHLPWLQGTPDPITTITWQTWIEINSKTAETMGLREGDVVEVQSPHGSIQVPVYPHPAIPPESVAIPLGQGHTVFGRYAENRGANVMDILDPTMKDSDTGALAWGATRVRIVSTSKHQKLPKFEGIVPSFPVVSEHGIIQITPDDE